MRARDSGRCVPIPADLPYGVKVELGRWIGRLCEAVREDDGERPLAPCAEFVRNRLNAPEFCRFMAAACAFAVRRSIRSHAWRVAQAWEWSSDRWIRADLWSRWRARREVAHAERLALEPCPEY